MILFLCILLIIACLFLLIILAIYCFCIKDELENKYKNIPSYHTWNPSIMLGILVHVLVKMVGMQKIYFES